MPEFFYPQDTWFVTQPWGVYNEAYRQFGFSRHNGQDLRLAPNKFVRAPFDGKVVKVAFQPFGGGIYFGFLSKNKYKFPDEVACHVLVDALHLEKTFCVPGKEYKVGDILAKADNTGYSTGPHTHYQWRRKQQKAWGLADVDDNEANNSFDPSPYLKGYAKDYARIRAQLHAVTLQVEQLARNIKNI